MNALLLFMGTVATRALFSSDYLYHFDSVNFALGITHYDISVHQPHPPGYFLYVMLGRLANGVFHDPNAAFIAIGAVFSGLAVAATYLLARDMFDSATALVAALIVMTSPSLWFNGEIALSYSAEAFFSVFTALCCYRTLRGDNIAPWCAVIALAIAGGFRQNTAVFMFPLLAWSFRKLSLRKILIGISAFIAFTVIWFVPMIIISGGWTEYREAFKELWEFNTGRSTVFTGGLPVFKMYVQTLFNFTFYGLGAGMVILALGAYRAARQRLFSSIDRQQTWFFVVWILPASLFYLFIFIHPGNPGYALILLPPLCLLTAASAGIIAKELSGILGAGLNRTIAAVLVGLNILIFFYSPYPVTYAEIRRHDRYVRSMLDEIRAFDPAKTVVLSEPYIFYGFRHVMYYLPDYTAYHIDLRRSKSGVMRGIFWGRGRETHLSDPILTLPEGADSFIAILIGDDRSKASGVEGVTITEVGSSGIALAHGPIASIPRLYPGLKVRGEASAS